MPQWLFERVLLVNVLPLESPRTMPAWLFDAVLLVRVLPLESSM
jgi:hypothetical protein